MNKTTGAFSSAAVSLLVACLLFSTSSAQTPPWNEVSFRPLLSQCRLQEPNSSPAAVSNGEFEGYATRKFQLVDGEMHLYQDSGFRNELRQNVYFNVADHVRIAARVEIPYPTLTAADDNFVVFQSHAKDYLDYNRGPLLTIRWMRSRRGMSDHLWANLREDLRVGSKKNSWYDLGPRPQWIL